MQYEKKKKNDYDSWSNPTGKKNETHKSKYQIPGVCQQRQICRQLSCMVPVEDSGVSIVILHTDNHIHTNQI